MRIANPPRGRLLMLAGKSPLMVDFRDKAPIIVSGLDEHGLMPATGY